MPRAGIALVLVLVDVAGYQGRILPGATQPSCRLPEEIADLMVFLASDVAQPHRCRAQLRPRCTAFKLPEMLRG